MEKKVSPVILLIFANTRDAFLQGIPEETQALQSIMDNLKGFEVVNLPYSKPEALLATLRQYRNRITILHFAGHTNSELWHMDKGSLNAQGIAELSRLIPNLKLLFLNGCQNVAQVHLFIKAGVPAIIATSRPIEDKQALQFGSRFYSNLIANQGNTAIIQAFDTAKSEVQALSEQPQRYRTLDIRNQNKDHSPKTWAWALYATSNQAEQWHLNKAVNNPCFGLPPLPPQDLPADPFRDLYFFREQDAEIFFGRCQQISDVFHHLTDTVNVNDPILLLHGQSGVGKSSFLAAGLVPRLKSAGNGVYYLRYDPLLGALGCLQHIFEQQDIVSAWRDWENRHNKPLIIILDQLEEVFTLDTKKNSESKVDRKDNTLKAENHTECIHFAQSLLPLFTSQDRDLRPRGKLVLSFRKEWLAEILNVCNQYNLPNSDYFLKALERNNIIDAVVGVTRQPRLKQKYRLSIKDTSEAKLSEIIADDLLADEESNIAPTLQILLSKLWRKVKPQTQRYFTLEAYNQLRKEGLLLEDHLDQQIDQIGKIKPWGKEAKNSGLILDILHSHTTPLGTARSISTPELQQLYPHIDNVHQIIEALINRYLLIHIFDNETSQLSEYNTRLAHDTLAALIRQRFENSVLPGQRARRLLDNRKEEWYEHDEDGELIHDEQGQCIPKATGPALGRSDLKVVEEGHKGMRLWDPVEQRLIEKSRRRRRLLRGLTVLRIGGIFVFLVFAAYYVNDSNKEIKKIAEQEQSALSLALSERALQISQTPGQLRGYQDRALLLALQAIKYNKSNGHKSRAARLESSQYSVLSQILYTDYHLPPHKFKQGSTFVSSQDQRWLAAFSADHTLSIWHLGDSYNARKNAKHTQIIDPDLTLKYLLFSPNSRYLAGISEQNNQHQLILWNVDNGKQINSPNGITGHYIKSLHFNPKGKNLVSIGQNCGLVWWSSHKAQPLQKKPINLPQYCIEKIKFNHNGERLVSLDNAGHIVWWHGENGALLHAENYHDTYSIQMPQAIDNHHITEMIFNPQGTRLITLGKTGNILWWDSIRGKKLTKQAITIEDHQIKKALFSPLKPYLVTLSEEANLVWWNTEKGQKLAFKKDLPHTVDDIIFTPAGHLISIGKDGSLAFWDDNYQLKDVHSFPQHRVAQLIFNQETAIFVSLNQEKDSLMWWNMETAEALTTEAKSLPDNTRFQKVIFSPNGQYLVTLDKEQHLHWWFGETAKKSHEEPFLFVSHSIIDVKFDHLSQQLISIAKEGSLVWWNAKKQQPYIDYLDTVRTSKLNNIENIFYSRDSKQRLSVNSDFKAEWFRFTRDTEQNEAFTLPYKQPLKRVYFDPNGNLILFHYKSGDFVLWQIANQQIHPKQPNLYSGAKSVIFDSDGKYLITQDENNKIILYEIMTGEEKKSLFQYNTDAALKDLIISPDNKYTIALTEDSKMLWYYRKDGRLITQKPIGLDEHNIQRLKFSPDSTYLVSVGKNGDLAWWMTTKDNTITPFLHPQKTSGHKAEDVVFSPDSRLVVSIDRKQHNFIFWDHEGNKLDMPERLHETLLDVVFHPDKPAMLSIGKNHISIWETKKQKLIIDHLRLNPFYKDYLAKAPDGHELAFRNISGNLVFLPLSDKKLLDLIKEQACNITGRNLSQAEWEEFIGSKKKYEATCPQNKYIEGVKSFRNGTVAIY